MIMTVIAATHAVPPIGWVAVERMHRRALGEGAGDPVAEGMPPGTLMLVQQRTPRHSASLCMVQKPHPSFPRTADEMASSCMCIWEVVVLVLDVPTCFTYLPRSHPFLMRPPTTAPAASLRACAGHAAFSASKCECECGKGGGRSSKLRDCVSTTP
jgi:hypothetical protein